MRKYLITLILIGLFMSCSQSTEQPRPREIKEKKAKTIHEKIAQRKRWA